MVGLSGHNVQPFMVATALPLVVLLVGFVIYVIYKDHCLTPPSTFTIVSLEYGIWVAGWALLVVWLAVACGSLATVVNRWTTDSAVICKNALSTM